MNIVKTIEVEPDGIIVKEPDRFYIIEITKDSINEIIETFNNTIITEAFLKRADVEHAEFISEFDEIEDEFGNISKGVSIQLKTIKDGKVILDDKISMEFGVFVALSSIGTIYSDDADLLIKEISEKFNVSKHLVN